MSASYEKHSHLLATECAKYLVLFELLHLLYLLTYPQITVEQTY